MPSDNAKKSRTTPDQSFADYKADANNWSTLASGEYCPDILKDACELYRPVLVLFGQLLKSSESSTRLFLHGLRTKAIFINDGPGFLLGSMWNDHATLERSHPGRIMVATLPMVPDRITREWLVS